VRVATQYASAPCKLTIIIFAFIRQVAPVAACLLFESGDRVTSDVATSMPILVFLGLSVLELGPMYALDRQTSDKRIA